MNETEHLALLALIEERDRLKVERDEWKAQYEDQWAKNTTEDMACGALDAIQKLLDEGSIPRGTFADDQVRNLVALYNTAEAKCDALREALARAQSWHESEDKALSKSGRSDADYHWRRLQHREQLEAIRGALPEAEYDAAWNRMNARYEQETADVGE